MEKLCLNKAVYSQRCIAETVKAFTGLCRMRIVESNDCFIVEFREFLYSEERTVKEFENYLIGLENQ